MVLPQPFWKAVAFVQNLQRDRDEFEDGYWKLVDANVPDDALRPLKALLEAKRADCKTAEAILARLRP